MAQQLLEDGRGGLSAVLARLRTATLDLADVTRSARAHPSGLLFGDPPSPVLESDR